MDDGKTCTTGRILLVEDHVDTRGVLLRVLGWEGYNVIAVADVGQAVRAADDAGPFDLVIADVVLPDGCGWTLFEMLRERWPSLVGIALSAHALPEHAARSLSAGFCAHVTKPADFTQLRSEVRRSLRSREGVNN